MSMMRFPVDNSGKSQLALSLLVVLVLSSIVVGISVSGSRLLPEAHASPGDLILSTAEVDGHYGQLSLPDVFEPECSACEKDAQGNIVTVTVDQDVTIDFNRVLVYGDAPTCDDGSTSDLCNYFAWDTPADTFGTGLKHNINEAWKWTAIFDLGGKKLVVEDNVLITIVRYYYGKSPTSDDPSPGIEIKACEMLVEGDLDGNGKPGTILIQSHNDLAGNILIHTVSDAVINGIVRNAVSGTGGFPGKITIASCYGDIITGDESRIETIGQDPGGSDINLLTCIEGDIVINGLVDASYKGGVAPTINIASFNGNVTIDGNNYFGIEEGTQRRVTSGVTVRSRHDPVPGNINIQAKRDITVYGNTVLEWRYPNIGAVGIKTNSSSPAGGVINVRSIEGKIVASDRAFDDANTYNTNAKVNLLSKGNIELSATGRKNSVHFPDGVTEYLMPVVSTQDGSVSHGGTNTLRSYAGSIMIGQKAQVLATPAGPPGGTNLLTSCTGVTNSGTVNPADLIPGDDSGVCVPSAPEPLFESCADFGVECASCIIVEKQTIPDGDLQQFMFTGNANGTIGDNDQIVVGNLLPGTYASTETVPGGWKLTDITCDDANSSGDLGTKTATFNLEASEVVKCTFTDEKLGTIVVEKQTIPDGDLQQFTFTGDAADTIGDDGQIIVGGLLPGTYNSTEVVPAGWDLTSIVCNDTDSSGDTGTGTATFDLDAGEVVKCTFTDEKLGTIIIEKVSVGGVATFNFTSDIPGEPPSFNITTASGSANQTTFSNLAAGTYNVTESGPSPPWNFTDLSCVPDQSISDQTATIDLPAGGSVKCTFTDEKPTGQLLGTIIIEKKTVGGDGTFDYASASSTTTPLPSQFSITTTDSLGNQTFINLQPGTYNVTESGPSPPWNFTDLKCTAGGSVSGQNATITLAAGETVTCTFTNELPTGPSCPFVNSKTIFGDELVPITLKADSKCPATPFCLTTEGTHKLKAPSSVWVDRVSYRFVRWEDDSGNLISTKTSLTYPVQSGETVYAVYEPAKYTLKVYVKDNSTGKPIVGATVELHYITNPPNDPQPLTTDKRGKVTFTKIYGAQELTLFITMTDYDALTTPTPPMTLTKDTKAYTAYLQESP
jgi:hypothetical protein